MKIIREVIRFVQECKDDNVTAYAAQSAYFTLLSLIPFLLFFNTFSSIVYPFFLFDIIMISL